MYEDYGWVRPVMGCDQDAVEVAERAARRGASALTLMTEAFAATRTMLLYLLNLKTAVTLSTS